MARPSVRDSGEISRQWIDGCCCFYQCWRHQPWSSSYHHCLFWWWSSWCHSSRYHSNEESVQQSDDCVVFWLPPDRSSATAGLKSNPIHSTLLLFLLPLFNSHEFNLPFMENLGYIWIFQTLKGAPSDAHTSHHYRVVTLLSLRESAILRTWVWGLGFSYQGGQKDFQLMRSDVGKSTTCSLGKCVFCPLGFIMGCVGEFAAPFPCFTGYKPKSWSFAGIIFPPKDCEDFFSNRKQPPWEEKHCGSDYSLLNWLNTNFFGVSCPQVQALRKFYPQLLVFGLRPSGEEVPLEGELQKTFARSLVFFDELLNFVSDLQAVIVNLVQQLGAIYTNNSPPSLYSSFTSVHLQTAFSSLADGFAVLVTIDEIVAQNLTIGHTMSLFTRLPVCLPACFSLPSLSILVLQWSVAVTTFPLSLRRWWWKLIDM